MARNPRCDILFEPLRIGPVTAPHRFYSIPRFRGSAGWLVCALASSAFAQAPFYTDDTSVTEPAVLHIEASNEIDALQSMQYPDLRQNTANLKINVGLPHGLELDVDAPYITIARTSDSSNSRGLGDTNMGIKWNVREPSADSHLLGFAVSFYTEFPTGDARQELGSGVTDYWLNLISQIPVSDRTRFNLNLGILFAGNTSTGVVGIETTRGQVYTGGLSVLHDVDGRLTIGGEIYGGIAGSNGLDRTQLQAMLGGQYLIRDGLTIYIGVVGGTFTASPRIGGQVGFALDFPAFFQRQSPGAVRSTERELASYLSHLRPYSAGAPDDL